MRGVSVPRKRQRTPCSALSNFPKSLDKRKANPCSSDFWPSGIFSFRSDFLVAYFGITMLSSLASLSPYPCAPGMLPCLRTCFLPPLLLAFSPRVPPPLPFPHHTGVLLFSVSLVPAQLKTWLCAPQTLAYLSRLSVPSRAFALSTCIDFSQPMQYT